MLKPVSLLSKAAVVTTDHQVGTIADLFFDERDWAIRYLVVDIGTWLFGTTTLIAPAAVREMDWEKRRVAINLTRKQIEQSPAVDTRKPVTRERELEIFTFYGWPAYWPAGGFTSAPPTPPPEYPLQPIRSMEDALAAPAEHFEDPHLRRLAEARGCRLQAADGDAGQVADFLMDGADWTIRYLLVATASERQVAVPVSRLASPRWHERQLRTELTRRHLAEAPAPEEGLEREAALDRYYGGR